MANVLNNKQTSDHQITTRLNGKESAAEVSLPSEALVTEAR